MADQKGVPVAAYFILVIGAFALASGIMLLRSTFTTRSYSEATGRIVERSLKEATLTSGGNKTGPRYERNVKYVYTVNGTEYSGIRISLTAVSYSKPRAEEALRALPEQVTVFYNPQNPQDALLERGGLALPIFVLLFGLLSVGGSALYLIYRKAGS